MGEIRVQPHFAAQEVLGIEPAEHHVGVRNRGLGPALRVAHRPRHGPGALRTGLKQSAAVDPGNRPAAGAHGGHFDERRRHGQAELDLPGRGVADGSVVHHADVRAGAAHVEADDVVVVQRFGVVLRRDDPAGQPGKHRLRRTVRRGLRQHLAAVGLHHRPRAGVPPRCETFVQRVDEPLQQRPDIGVGNGRARAVVLPPDRRDLVRERNRKLGKLARQILADHALVVGLDVRKQAVDRHGHRAVGSFVQACAQHVAQAAEGRRRQRVHDLAHVVEPLRHAHTVAAGDQGLRSLPVEVVVELAIHALQKRHVLESGGGHIQHPGALALEQRIDANRGAEHEIAHVGGGNAAVLERVENRVTRRVGR